MLLAGTLHSDRFLSTPSARRATMEQIRRRINNGISIHALREEGDLLRAVCILPILYFYPRPPRGGRHQPTADDFNGVLISIHALREEGDGCRRWRSPVS